jgi:hypothetical protein
MSFILRELRDYAKRPLDKPQSFLDYLVFGNRPHKPQKPQETEIKNEEMAIAERNIKNEQLSPAGKAPIEPPALAPSILSPPKIPPPPPLPSPPPTHTYFTPPPPASSPIYQPPEDKINKVDDLLKSIREGKKLKPVNKQPKKSKSFLEELQNKPKLIRKEVKQKPKVEKPLSLNDLIKQNKKFQALAQNSEINENWDEDFGFGKKRRRKKIILRF